MVIRRRMILERLDQHFRDPRSRAYLVAEHAVPFVSKRNQIPNPFHFLTTPFRRRQWHWSLAVQSMASDHDHGAFDDGHDCEADDDDFDVGVGDGGALYQYIRLG